MANVVIKELSIGGFGKFRNKNITLSEGINLITGGNESGKSTIQAFISGMLFGFFNNTSKRKSYTAQQLKYQPWDGGTYRGVLVCVSNGREYRIERDFGKDTESVRVLDNVTGEDITKQFPYQSNTRLYEPGETLLGVSKTTFNNTANIAQLGCPTAPELAAEVNDRLISMLKTADSDISITNVLASLKQEAEAIGTPKKSKSPYGMAIIRQKELKEEFGQAKERESEYFELCEKLTKLRDNQHILEKEQKLLESKLQDSAAKEIADRYLKVQNIKIRLDRLEKEIEKLSCFDQVNLEIVDTAQKKMGAKSQILRTLNKYDRALEELEKRVGEINLLYATLDIATTDPAILDQFDQMYERYKNNLSAEDEIKQLQIKLSNISFSLGKMSLIDSSELERDVKEYDSLEQEKEEPQPPKNIPKIAMYVSGAILILLGLILGIAIKPIFGLISLVGIGLAIGANFIKTVVPKRQPLEELAVRQTEILERYKVPLDDPEHLPRELLESLLGRVQVNNYKYHQFEEQVKSLKEEIETKAAKATETTLEVKQYMGQLAETSEVVNDAIKMKTLMETVKKAKRINLEMQKFNMQGQQILKEKEICTKQVEGITEDIQKAVDACGVNTPDELEKCRVGKQKLSELNLECKMQKQLLEQCLGSYTIEELATAAQQSRLPTNELPEKNRKEEKKAAQERIKTITEELSELYQQAAGIEGQQKALEEIHRPLGQVEQELAEVTALCDRYEEELQAIAMATEKIGLVSSDIHRDFAPQLNMKVSDLVSFLTNHRYDLVTIDSQMQIHLEDSATSRMVDLASLSSGTIDMIYMAMRVELITLLKGPRSVPLIFDDSFSLLDDSRLEKLLRYLWEIKPSQVLLFTCHGREKQILDQFHIPYNHIAL